MEMSLYYPVVSYKNDWIGHHGVLGQKWGIRRYQNKDGTLTAEGRERYLVKGIKPEELEKNEYNLPVEAMDLWESGKDFKIKKGSTAYRVTSKEDENGSNPKYVSFLKSDEKGYTQGADYIGINTLNEDIWNTEFNTISDIKVAGGRAALDALIKTVGPKKMTDMSLLKNGDLGYARLGDKRAKKRVEKALKKSNEVDTSKWSDDQVKQYLYYFPDEKDNYNEDILKTGSEEDKKNYANYLKQKGYDAVIDMVDTNIGFADTPTIVLDPEKTLKKKVSKQVWSSNVGWLD